MREKYESLPLSELKEIAKVRGIKGISAMKKKEIVEAMLAEDERLKKEESAAEKTQAPVKETAKKEESVAEKAQAPVREMTKRDKSA